MSQTPLFPEAVLPAAAPTEIDRSTLTPMVLQYLDVKTTVPDCILFFRLGDFYEIFFEDAQRASEILGITLTSRAKGAERIPMCGVPYHAARGYIAKLVEQGLKVAICDQTSKPKPGTIVRREVMRIVTPGMVLDDEVQEPKENRFLVALKLADDRTGVALVDASTGEFRAGSVATAQLGEELSRLGPRELLVEPAQKEHPALKRALQVFATPPPVNTLDPEGFETAKGKARLCQHFAVQSLDSFGLGDDPLAVGAAGAALRYLQETQKARPAHVVRLQGLSTGAHLVIDESTRGNLELVRTQRDGKRSGSLVGLLDRTVTALGARALQRWLLQPLWELPAIHARLDAVEELSKKGVLREELSGLLKRVGDIERLTSRLTLGQGNARDLFALGRSLGALPELGQKLAGCQSALLKEQTAPLGTLGDLATLLQSAVNEEAPVSLKEGGMIRLGFHVGLDTLLKAASDGKDYLLKLETREKERTKISSLKIRFNSVFGYFIEVTKANLHLVPKDYQRKQTTAGGERFFTEELKKHEEAVLGAEEKQVELEAQIFEELRAQVIARTAKLRDAAEAVAALDALGSLARCAAEYGYVRPVVDDSEILEIVEGRHPVVERLLQGERFVPNDLLLDCNHAQLVVLTGPNMAGKSTVMRQVALIALMAQAGSFVPAKSARIGRCDRIFTRVGASDNLVRGQSTFMVEMTETASILNNATRRSLIILDEIGRGTSTFDGLSIAWAVAEHLHDQVGARALFATHYHELVDLAREKPRVKNRSIAVKEWQGKVIFLRKLVEGGASRSYGIEVAKLAGLPGSVLGRAREILKNLESGELDAQGKAALAHGAPSPRAEAAQAPPPEPPVEAAPLPMAGKGASEVERAIRALSLDMMTPLEALNLLAKLKKQLSGGPGGPNA
jgi:DNA mismatch repair protein MutS